MTAKIEEFSTREALTEAALTASTAAIEAGIAERGRAFLALSGGSTPVALYGQLSRADLAWEKVVVTLADERIAPESSGARNDDLLDTHLLKNRAAAAHLVPLSGEGRLQQVEFPLDLAILGMGEDAHTASLFPGGEGLEAALSGPAGEVFRVTPAILPDGAPFPRLTLTPAAFAKARQTLLLVTGAKKRAVLEEALSADDAAAMPVRAVLHADCPALRVLYAD